MIFWVIFRGSTLARTAMARMFASRRWPLLALCLAIRAALPRLAWRWSWNRRELFSGNMSFGPGWHLEFSQPASPPAIFVLRRTFAAPSASAASESTWREAYQAELARNELLPGAWRVGGKTNCRSACVFGDGARSQQENHHFGCLTFWSMSQALETRPSKR